MRGILISEVQSRVQIAIDAYTAGIIDGEGSIIMSRSSTKNKYGVFPYWTLKMQVVSCDEELVIWLKEQWGGAYNRYARRGINHRPAYRWTVVGDNMRAVLVATLPYLLLKKEKAEWASEALNIQAEPRVPWSKYSEEKTAKLAEIRQRFVDHTKRIKLERERNA